MGQGKGLTFHRDFPAAGQVCLVAHQNDGHVVGLVRTPQLDAELGGALEAAAIGDGVHDDVGAARPQALLAPAFTLRGRDPRLILRGCLALAVSRPPGCP